MRLLLLLLLLLAGLLVVSSCQSTITERVGDENLSLLQQTAYLNQLRGDVAAHQTRVSQAVAACVDLRRPDTANRFFVFNLRDGRLLVQGCCLNGLTDHAGQVRYSNRPGSNCSSRGLACVSTRYAGSFGRAYRLVGLEPATSNLVARSVVLHSWWGVPAGPGAEHPVQSQGCPTLNPAVLDAVAKVVDRTPRPVLIRLY